jgi:hypothetical protein
MRCQCCNRNLSNYESTLRHPETNEYLDICMKCLADIPITPISNNTFNEDTGFEPEDTEMEFEVDHE